MKRIILGTCIGWSLAYAAATFIFADFYWLHDLFAWSRYDRFQFLYVAICSGGIGGWLAGMLGLTK